MTSQQSSSSLMSGKLDPDFGKDGFKYLTSPLPDYPKYHSTVVAVGPDDMIYVAGEAYGDLGAVCTVTRLDQNGAIDDSFGNKGFFYSETIGTHQADFPAEQIAFSEGKILVSGEMGYYNEGPRYDKVIIRLNLNGTIDETFGEKGAFIFYTPDVSETSSNKDAYNEKRQKTADSRLLKHPKSNTTTPSTSNSMMLADGRLLLLHESGSFLESCSFIIRVTQDGKLDTTFNKTGFIKVAHDKFNFTLLRSLTVTSTGDYISAGIVRHEYRGTPEAIVLVKHDKNGQLITDFQTEGFKLIKSSDTNSYFTLSSTKNQTNNRILCLGAKVERGSTSHEGLLISLEENGHTNIQFNGGEPVFFRVNSKDTYFSKADFLSSGKFLVTGITRKGELNHYAVTRFLANGAHDEEYGNGGWFEYRQTIVPSYYSSVIAHEKIIMSSFPDDGDLGRRPIARGLMS